MGLKGSCISVPFSGDITSALSTLNPHPSHINPLPLQNITEAELGQELGITNTLHRLKLRLAVQEIVTLTSSANPQLARTVSSFSTTWQLLDRLYCSVFYSGVTFPESRSHITLQAMPQPHSRTVLLASFPDS